jgi:hypothetical protein
MRSLAAVIVALLLAPFDSSFALAQGRPFDSSFALAQGRPFDSGFAFAQGKALATCEPERIDGALARDYVIRGEHADKALEAWTRTLDGGGAVTWTATLYDVDAYSFFVLAFDRKALRIYRFGALAGAFEKQLKGIPVFPPASNERFWRAMAGCVDPAAAFEAEIPWSDVEEIKSGNWVIWIKFRTPARIGSDRGKSRSVRELKMNLHGQTGDLTFYYNVGYYGEVHNLRGIAVGPADYQRRVQHMLATMFDSGRRIRLPQKGRGAGW